ncbi:unnamed protein product [Rotaria socialis]|uniref:Hint domain-containing protein n=1 Tax=Rotaria socialis TaxID=392032 RepID=A0A818BFN6_9BILA|nr:unnamed protein product [Rotaria socialis]CAF3296345.1 unnamed protein product [Rotaria socialis]CAF3338025.1 unnamed protein product [Rotaria socialis]CAF3357798.1 unnamed protein product [Rotaria socialis]CAF3416151.1 unnamed protein product [Rotaria socialis]
MSSQIYVFICVLISIIIQLSLAQVPCSLEDDPIQLAECAQLDVQAIIQAAKGNLKLFCNLAERYMECFKTKTRNCIGGSIAEGGFTELQNLAQWCCVNPGSPEPDECPLNRNPKCFSGDDFVSMANGEKKLLRELRPGDRVLVMNSQKQVEEDEVIMILDSQPSRPALFYSIETETGHRVSLTGNHFIAVNHNNHFVPANQIKTHDMVFIHSQGKLQSVSVRNVSEEYKVGYFTPMTSQGTLIVNDMAASCYASVVSHSLAHQVLAPLRWWYRFAKLFAVEQPFEYTPAGGIHWLPQAMLQITEKYLPSVLVKDSL